MIVAMNDASPTHSWMSLIGPFEPTVDGITFKGFEFEPPPVPGEPEAAGPTPPAKSEASQTSTSPEPPGPKKRPSIGQAMCNHTFTEGRISAEIEFSKVEFGSVAEIILQYDPLTEDMLTIGLGGDPMRFFSLRFWTGSDEAVEGRSGGTTQVGQKKAWKYLRSGGDRVNLQANRPYKVDISVRGSLITMKIDGVDVGAGVLPFQLPGRQVGVFCLGSSDIHFRHFKVDSAKPQAFVVMQFNTPEYEELFKDVIEPVCDSAGLRVYRADQTYSPGVIVADIQNQIAMSRVIIAEITPVNGNVYYEVGYADALRKPIILVADKRVEELPFDVRPYRTIFYDNTIGGKNRVQEALTKFLTAITGGSGAESSR